MTLGAEPTVLSAKNNRKAVEVILLRILTVSQVVTYPTPGRKVYVAGQSVCAVGTHQCRLVKYSKASRFTQLGYPQ